MSRITAIILGFMLLSACKPTEVTLHDLMMDPAQSDAIVLQCSRGSDSTLCHKARRARREREFLLSQLRGSPEGFGLRIMDAQRKLASLEAADTSEATIVLQKEHIKELQFITHLAGE